MQVAEVRLVIRVNTAHQFQVRRAVVAEFAVPGATKGGMTPSPLFLAGCNQWICYINEPAVGLVIETAQESISGVDHHVTRRNRNVFVRSEIIRSRPPVIIDTVILARSDRE